MTETVDNHVVVVGCGGNIGSHLIPHLARMSEVNRVTLIDRDVYEPANLRTQDIVPSEVGKAKALVQARRLRRIDPTLQVEAIVGPVENVALGRLKSKLILAGVDSRRARQVINEKAWELGTTWIDAGVDGAALLARVSVYFPGSGTACAICGWDQTDFDAVETEYPCSDKENGDSNAEPPATNAPSSVGALAASLQAIECRKVLSGSAGPGGAPTAHGSRGAREILFDAAYGNLYVTALAHNPDCLMPIHGSVAGADSTERADLCSHAARIGEVIGRSIRPVSGRVQGAEPIRLEVIGQPFVTSLTCEKCGTRRPFLKLKASLQRGRRVQSTKCTKCGREMVATGFDTVDELDVDSLSPRTLSLSLNSIGVRRGDVLRVKYAGGSARTIEIGKDEGEPPMDSPPEPQPSRRHG